MQIVERADLMELAKLEHLHWIVLACAPGIAPEDFTKSQQYANDHLNRVRAFLRPWVKIETDTSANFGHTMRKAWSDKFGDPSDPEVVAKIAMVLEKFNESYQRAHGGA